MAFRCAQCGETFKTSCALRSHSRWKMHEIPSAFLYTLMVEEDEERDEAAADAKAATGAKAVEEAPAQACRTASL